VGTGYTPVSQLRSRAISGSRERLAWTILLASLFVCLGLTVAVPVTVNLGLQLATRPLDLFAQSVQGTVVVQHNGASAMPLLSGAPAVKLNPAGVIITNSPDTALLMIQAPRSNTVLAWLQIYGGSNLRVEKATAPRFEMSSQEQFLQSYLAAGRIQIAVPAQSGRAFAVRVITPHGEVGLREPGRYTVEVSQSETQVAVQAGEAWVMALEQSLVLQGEERAVLVAAHPPQGPLDSERNLIRNGDFGDGLAHWVILAGDVERPDQPAVKAELTTTIEGESALRFERIGVGHADRAVRQIVEQDVTDFTALRVYVTLRLLEQSLAVCGRDGSECPLLVRIVYEDLNGIERTWQQGFYAVGEFHPDETPDVCLTCTAPYNSHEYAPQGQLFPFESPNLIEALARDGLLPPRRIKSVFLVASGHSFESYVIDVALMAQQ
jgi:hypothetical protein